MHYARLYRHGTLDKPTPQEIFWSKVEKTDNCWLWRGYVQPDGYPRFKFEGRPHNAHRLAYMWLISPIPDGLQIDHLCRVKTCVNPEHLEAVTPGENTRRVPDHPIMLNAAKTHCPHGHEYDLLNTYYCNGHRICRACRTRQQREKRARRRARQKLQA
jgi:HNH endonuclease